MVGNDFEEVFIVLMFRKIVISLFEGKVLGLDKVIFYSIDCCCKYIWGGGEIVVK